jgi:predicted MFS family arabinose efflux permease
MLLVSRPSRLALAGCAFLALADTGVVALALPPILRELDTDVAGVAAVLGVYALVLAVALLAVRPLQRAAGVPAAGVIGVLLFSAGSLECGLANSLGVLLAARAVQAVGGAILLVTAYTLLSDDEPGTRLWRLAALIGTAAGPALGGALTQAFGWRSIFLIQAPAALAALPACLRARERRLARATPAREPVIHLGKAIAGVALALLSGALAAALFLTVLLLVSGWSVEPLAAAAAVSVVPLAALLTYRLGGPPATRAVAGCLLLAGGTAAFAFLPGGSIVWTLAPQLLVGLGMGLALPALAGELLPERDPRQAARLLSARHLGIALVLALLAPIAQHSIDTTLETTREQGAALILDARIAPDAKLKIAPLLAETVETEDPRGGLDRTFADGRDLVDDDDLAEYDQLRDDADEMLVNSVISGFAPAYLTAAALALLAAIALALHPLTVRRTSRDRAGAGISARWVLAGGTAGLLLAALIAALVVPAGYAALDASTGPKEVVIADPCEKRSLPDTGGILGFAQDTALQALDKVACKAGSSREQLVLALIDEQEAKTYQHEYGVDPRSAIDLAQLVFGG